MTITEAAANMSAALHAAQSKATTRVALPSTVVAAWMVLDDALRAPLTPKGAEQMTRVRVYYRVTREESTTLDIDAEPDDIDYAEIEARLRDDEPFDEIQVDDFEVLDDPVSA